VEEPLNQVLESARELIDRQPVLALALGGALAALFLTTVLKTPVAAPGVGSWLAHRAARLVWGFALVAFLAIAVMTLRSYLTRVQSEFRHAHGRITEVNLQAVRTIWGSEQVQGELTPELGYDVEDTERLESEDPTQPALIRKTKRYEVVTANPFIAARHDVMLTTNARQKGSAVYAGYETQCRFTYQLKNPESRDIWCKLRFPLPNRSAMLDDLVVKFDGQSVADRVRVEDAHLVFERTLAANQAFSFEVAFKSRGLSNWYMQVRQPREIRDFTLTLMLPDIPVSELNYPEGCMTPTSVVAVPDGDGSVLIYRLDRAISTKGMGVALPKPEQPGAAAAAILGEVEIGWVLLFAAALLGLTLGESRWPALAAVLLSAGVAMAYGLVSNLFDSPIGFWGAAAVVLMPCFAGVAWLAIRWLRGIEGKLLAGLLVLVGLVYPLVAGLDVERDALYLDLAGLLLLGMAAVQLTKRWASAASHDSVSGGALAGA
jgi:hypothetical protein